jgi:hypothetical protein
MEPMASVQFGFALHSHSEGEREATLWLKVLTCRRWPGSHD